MGDPLAFPTTIKAQVSAGHSLPLQRVNYHRVALSLSLSLMLSHSFLLYPPTCPNYLISMTIMYFSLQTDFWNMFSNYTSVNLLMATKTQNGPKRADVYGICRRKFQCLQGSKKSRKGLRKVLGHILVTLVWESVTPSAALRINKSNALGTDISIWKNSMLESNMHSCLFGSVLTKYLIKCMILKLFNLKVMATQ